MPQPKAPQTDWLFEGWKLAETLLHVPTRRLKLRQVGTLPLDEDVERDLQELQHRLNEFLNHHVSKQIRMERAATHRFDSDDPRRLIATRNQLEKAGVNFDDRMTAAIFAHAQIGSVRRDLYLDDERRIKLPVIVASISGKSVALQTAIAAAGRRKRRNQLREAKLKAMAGAGGDRATWKDLLRTLVTKGIVTNWDDKEIHWIEKLSQDDVKYRQTATSTFRGWNG